jgi:hypothetical protein
MCDLVDIKTKHSSLHLISKGEKEPHAKIGAKILIS